MTEHKSKSMVIEIAYARPSEQVILEVEVEEGATVKGAIEQSGILYQFQEIDLEKLRQILAGINFWEAHEQLEYSSVY